MFAMIVLLALCFRAATIAVSMAIDRPETIDAASACGPKRSGGCQAGDFLASRGMAAQPPGEESPTTALRLVDRGVVGLRPDQAINETEWCVLPGTEKPKEDWRSSLARPQTPVRKSFALPRPLTAGARNGKPGCPAHRIFRARTGTPASIEPPAAPVHHDMMLASSMALAPIETRKHGNGHIKLIRSRQQVTTAPVFQALPKQRAGMPQVVSTPSRQ
jgi:hypothetical protein